MTLFQRLARIFRHPNQSRAAAPSAKVRQSAERLSDRVLQHISRDTRAHTLTSILNRQIVDARFRLATLSCDDARIEQTHLIDRLMQRRAQEITNQPQFA